MQKGFTLIELLIVIGILAILTAAVVVALNPAQLLAQARDSQRLSDLDALRSAIALYAATATTVTFGETLNCTAAGTPSTGSCTTTTSTVVTGTGWVAVALSDTSGGSPLAALPLDPTNSTTYFYAYDGDNTNKTFEVDAVLESTKYSGKMTTDGGSSASFYEIGTDPGLDLI